MHTGGPPTICPLARSIHTAVLCRRTIHKNLHVRGYKEEGTTTTPFDMVVLNGLGRFHLAANVIDRIPGMPSSGSATGCWITNPIAANMGRICRRFATGDGAPKRTRRRFPFQEVVAASKTCIQPAELGKNQGSEFRRCKNGDAVYSADWSFAPEDGLLMVPSLSSEF